MFNDILPADKVSYYNPRKHPLHRANKIKKDPIRLDLDEETIPINVDEELDKFKLDIGEKITQTQIRHFLDDLEKKYNDLILNITPQKLNVEIKSIEESSEPEPEAEPEPEPEADHEADHEVIQIDSEELPQ